MRIWGLELTSSLIFLAAMTAGCSNDCSDEIETGERFLSAAANLSCGSDTDCVVVTTGCHTFAGGFCSQSYLSRTAANSAEWSSIKGDLDDCENDCAVCAGGLSPPRCVDKVCGSPD